MHVHLPEADFGKLRIWRPKEVLYRYEEVYGLVKDSSVANMICIDKVVIVCAGRIEKEHQNAVKQFTKWPQYEKYKPNFVFIYNKCESDDSATKEVNLLNMCEFFGAEMSVQEEQAGMSYAQPQAEAVSLNSWLVFPLFWP
jgi:hypothetical protein